MDKLNLKAILVEASRPRIRSERVGRNNDHTIRLLGSTSVSIDAGEISSQVQWGIHGTEVQLSSDVSGLVDCFVIEGYGMDARAEGYYVFRNRSGHILAEARVKGWAGTKSEFYVRGNLRQDVVKLFELIRDDETVPESAGGRRGLIRNLREQIAGLLVSADELVDYKVAYEQQVRDNIQQLDKIAKLKAENTELKKPKGFWQVFLANFRRSYDAQVA